MNFDNRFATTRTFKVRRISRATQGRYFSAGVLPFLCLVDPCRMTRTTPRFWKPLFFVKSSQPSTGYMHQPLCCTVLAAKFWVTSCVRYIFGYFWEAARVGQGHFFGAFHIFVVETSQTACAYTFFWCSDRVGQWNPCVLELFRQSFLCRAQRSPFLVPLEAARRRISGMRSSSLLD